MPFTKGHRLALLLLLSTNSQLRRDINATPASAQSILKNAFDPNPASPVYPWGTLNYGYLLQGNQVTTDSQSLRIFAGLADAGGGGYGPGQGCPTAAEDNRVFVYLGQNI